MIALNQLTAILKVVLSGFVILFPEPGLLDELARRVEEAEKKFQAADLDLRLKELDAAKQRQVYSQPSVSQLGFRGTLFCLESRYQKSFYIGIR